MISLNVWKSTCTLSHKPEFVIIVFLHAPPNIHIYTCLYIYIYPKETVKNSPNIAHQSHFFPSCLCPNMTCDSSFEESIRGIGISNSIWQLLSRLKFKGSVHHVAHKHPTLIGGHCVAALSHVPATLSTLNLHMHGVSNKNGQTKPHYYVWHIFFGLDAFFLGCKLPTIKPEENLNGQMQLKYLDIFQSVQLQALQGWMVQEPHKVPSW